MGLLVNAFNPGTVAGLMCKDTLSVDWQGRLFDCDFNQQLDLPLAGSSTSSNDSSSASSSSSTSTSSFDSGDGSSRKGLTVWDIATADLLGGGIAVGDHCYGCTAGAGSGCQGATTST